MFGLRKAREERMDEEAFRERRKITELREDVMVLIGLLPAELLDHDLVKDIDARFDADIGSSPVRFYKRKRSVRVTM